LLGLDGNGQPTGAVKSEKKIGFAEMAKEISTKWKALDEETAEHYQSLAVVEKKKYQEKMRLFNGKRKKSSKKKSVKRDDSDE